MRNITYRNAINEALTQEMERDSSVFVYGIDVGDHKRIFGTTTGILEKFGIARCFSTPLAEDTMLGFGLGAAINGMRPINVHMRMDFLLLAMNQLINMISSQCYGSGGATPVPIVIRAIIGRGWGQSYQHSKSLHSFLGHCPGIKVVMPSTPYEVKGMLTSAIRDNNPVVVIEHRWMYDVIGNVPEEQFEVSLDDARIIRQGRDITVVAVSWMNIEAMKAAEILCKYGIDIEVINACSTTFKNHDILFDSIKKTGHCIIADNSWTNCGFGSEIAARIAENCPGYLKKPLSRIGFSSCPCPCTRPLEDEFYPNAIEIIRAIESQLGLEEIDLSQESFYSYEDNFKGPF